MLGVTFGPSPDRFLHGKRLHLLDELLLLSGQRRPHHAVAGATVEEWPQDLDVLRTLRSLKNRINMFRTLDDPPDEIRPWLNLWSLLP